MEVIESGQKRWIKTRCKRECLPGVNRALKGQQSNKPAALGVINVNQTTKDREKSLTVLE